MCSLIFPRMILEELYTNLKALLPARGSSASSQYRGNKECKNLLKNVNYNLKLIDFKILNHDGKTIALRQWAELQGKFLELRDLIPEHFPSLVNVHQGFVALLDNIIIELAIVIRKAISAYIE